MFPQNPKTTEIQCTTLEDLNDDLLTEILHRLPLRFLLQCKSLNKRFYRLISDPTFFYRRVGIDHRFSPSSSKTHTLFLLFPFNSSSNHNNLMLLSLDSNSKTLMLKGSNFLPRSWPLQDPDRVRVKATHHDLILCSTEIDSYIHYFICNPFTKHSVALPPIPLSDSEKDAAVGFICNRSRSRFRVMHISILDSELSTFKVNMFLSEIAEWHAYNLNLPDNEIVMSRKPCSSMMTLHNEKFIWCMRQHVFLTIDPFKYDLVFNWKIMDMPPRIVMEPDVDRTMDICTGICNGRVKTCEWLNFHLSCVLYESIIYQQSRIYIINGSACDSSMELLLEEEKDIKLLAIHPHCESKIYLYSKSKKSIFLYDYGCRGLDCCVYTSAQEDEDICEWGNVMSLILPEWPTQVPTL